MPTPPSPDNRRAQRASVAARLASLEELEVTIEKLVMGGDGLARHQGIPIFVPRAVPGDRLWVRLVQRRPDYARAEILEVRQQGPGRRLPPCPHFERCGGCDLQQIEDHLQPELKAAAVVETLARLGRLSLPPPQLIVGEAWGYRLRAQLHGGSDEGGRPALGYYARRSRDLVAVGCCPILDPALESALPRLQETLPERPPRRLDLAAGDAGRWTAAPVVSGWPRGPVELTVGEFTYRYDARTFFQSHRGLLPRLLQAAVGDWSGQLAVDLYAGVGLFSLPLARRYRRVLAVENDPAAVRYGRINARQNGVEGLELISDRAELALARLSGSCDRMVVDPPRAGLSREVRAGILERRPARLTYVSCDPPTLARDLRQLTAAYRVGSWALLDLFPQTGHMEAVVQLEAEGG